MRLFIRDFWLWGQVRIEQESCNQCKDTISINIEKKDINKIIKILNKLNYKGVPKKKNWNYSFKEWIISDDSNNDNSKTKRRCEK